MEEYQESVQQDQADARATQESESTPKLSGDDIFERFSAGESIETINEDISAGLEYKAEENDVPDQQAESEEGEEQEESSDRNDADAEEKQEQRQETDDSRQEAAKQRTFTQRELDYIIGKRTSEQTRKHSALLDDLSVILGVDKNSVVDAVRKQRYQTEAEAKGISDPELYAEKRKLQEENEQIRRQQAVSEQQRAFLDEVDRQVGQLSKQNPAFDMARAAESQPFVAALEAFYQNPQTRGQAVAMAYRSVFYEDTVKAAVQREKEKIIASVQSGKARISEGAAKDSQQGAQKIDVSRMTDEQIAQIADRVRKGEKITF